MSFSDTVFSAYPFLLAIVSVAYMENFNNSFWLFGFVGNYFKNICKVENDLISSILQT